MKFVVDMYICSQASGDPGTTDYKSYSKSDFFSKIEDILTSGTDSSGSYSFTVYDSIGHPLITYTNADMVFTDPTLCEIVTGASLNKDYIETGSVCDYCQPVDWDDESEGPYPEQPCPGTNDNDAGFNRTYHVEYSESRGFNNVLRDGSDWVSTTTVWVPKDITSSATLTLTIECNTGYVGRPGNTTGVVDSEDLCINIDGVPGCGPPKVDITTP